MQWEYGMKMILWLVFDANEGQLFFVDVDLDRELFFYYLVKCIFRFSKDAVMWITLIILYVVIIDEIIPSSLKGWQFVVVVVQFSNMFLHKVCKV